MVVTTRLSQEPRRNAGELYISLETPYLVQDSPEFRYNSASPRVRARGKKPIDRGKRISLRYKAHHVWVVLSEVQKTLPNSSIPYHSLRTQHRRTKYQVGYGTCNTHC